jgi:hypothetical protein
MDSKISANEDIEDVLNPKEGMLIHDNYEEEPSSQVDSSSIKFDAYQAVINELP